MAHVELLLSALPSHVRTARLVVVAAARRAGLDDSLVDELRLAVGEACSRAVGLHRSHTPDTPVRVLVADDATGLTISVTDHGPAAAKATEPSALTDELLDSDDVDDLIDPDVALAVLSGLVDDCQVEAGPGGTTVTMRWPLPPRPVGLAGTGATSISQT